MDIIFGKDVLQFLQVAFTLAWLPFFILYLVLIIKKIRIAKKYGVPFSPPSFKTTAIVFIGLWIVIACNVLLENL